MAVRPLPRQGPLLCCDFHQFDAAVPGPALLRLIRGDGRIGPGAVGTESSGGDAVPGDERGDDRLGPGLRQLQVGGGVGRHVGVPDDVDLQAGVLPEQFGDLGEGGFGVGSNLGLADIEIDAVERDAAGLAEVLGHGLGVDDDVLLHRLFLDDVHHDVDAAGLIADLQGAPGLFAVARELERGPLVRTEEHTAAGGPGRVLLVADDLQLARHGGVLFQVVMAVDAATFDDLFLLLASLCDGKRPGVEGGLVVAHDVVTGPREIPG